MTTENGPLTEALLSIVPEITPVFGLIDSPGGSVLPAEKVRTSLVSVSVKNPDTSRGVMF